MCAEEQNEPSLTNLTHMFDYFKYLYEEENHRNEKLTSTTSNYLVVITFAFSFFAGLLSWMAPNISNFLGTMKSAYKVWLIGGLGLAVIFILLSLIFTLMVIKVRPFERLCDPKDYAAEASEIKTEEELISSIISHFVVATDRNFHINNQKAKFLAYGLQTYIVGFVLLLSTLSGIYLVGR